MYYITVYEVSREYGGPEEGGWWYDWYEYHDIAAIVPDQAVARNIAALLTADAKQDKKSNGEQPRHSVIGTPDTVYLMEEKPGSQQTNERPVYC